MFLIVHERSWLGNSKHMFAVLNENILLEEQYNFFKTPLGSKNDVGRGCLATLSVLVVRISLLEYSKIHENLISL